MTISRANFILHYYFDHGILTNLITASKLMVFDKQSFILVRQALL